MAARYSARVRRSAAFAGITGPNRREIAKTRSSSPTTTCASLPADACTRLTERCAQGIDGRVDADGGVCAAAPAVVP